MSVLFLPPSAGAASVPDATETTAGKIRIATSAEATAGTNDLTSMTPLKVKSVVDAAVVGGVTYQGTFDASSPADLSNASKGDLYIISVAGSYQGQDWAVGDHLLINADMGGTLDPNKIDKVDNTDSVTSVAGRTGAVVLSASDVSGLATVATSGAYSDLSGTPSLATVATTGAYSDLSGLPTLGTAAALDVGTSANNVVQLNGSAQLPAVDGSQLTGISATVAALDDVGDVTITSVADGEFLKYDSASGDWVNGDSGLYSGTTYSTTATVPTPSQPQTLSIRLSNSSSQTLTLPTGSSDLLGTTINLVSIGTGEWTINPAAGQYVRGLSSALTLNQNQTAILTLTQDVTWYVVAYEEQGLGDLFDVTISTPANGEALIYNSTSGDWENSTVSATVAALNDIGDVSAAAPNDDDLLAYNSTSGDWETRPQATNTTVSTTSTAAAIDNKGVNTYSFISSSVTLTIPQATQLNGLAIFNNTASSTQQTISGSSVVFVVSGNTNVSSFTLEPGETRTFLVRAAGVFHEISADRLERQGDVNISSPANGEALVYNSTSGDWENGTVSASAPSVTVSSPSTDQTLSAPSGIEEAYIYTPSANITVNLVAAATCGSGFKYQIKNRSTNTITIDPNGSETIDGSATFDIATQEASVTLLTDGSSWFII